MDWIVLRRFGSRLGITFCVFLGLFMLVETLNTGKIQALTALGGPLLAGLGVFLSGLRSSITALPETVLIGTVAGVIDLQLRRELTVMQSSGLSVWRLFRAPIIAVLLFAGALSILGETTIITLNRNISGQPASRSAPVWLEQTGDDGAYLFHAQRVTATPPDAFGVEVFITDAASRDRIVATSAELSGGRWVFHDAVRYRPDVRPQSLPDFTLATRTSLGDLKLLATGTSDLTLGELMGAAVTGVAENQMRAETLTTLYWTFMRPLMVIGSMLIGIAAAARFRRTVRYGDTVLFALICSFVLFTINEMAIREGISGALAPVLASAGPAVVSILIGVTALLYSQDGTI